MGSDDEADLADAGQEVVERVLGGDSALDSPAAGLDVFLCVAEWLAGRDPELVGHEVGAGDHFGHGVLDLEAGVHLEEVVVAFVIEQELDGAGVGVVAGPGDARRRGLAHAERGVRRRLPATATPR